MLIPIGRHSFFVDVWSYLPCEVFVFFFKRQCLRVSVKKNSFPRQISFLQQCIVCWSFQSIHVLFSFQSEGSHLSHCTRLSPTLLTSSFALYFIELCSVYFYLTVITNPKSSPLMHFPVVGAGRCKPAPCEPPAAQEIKQEEANL